MTEKISFTVNGREATVQTDPDRMLLDVLREDLQLTGPKYGCGEGACGACGVLVGGRRVFSCSKPVKSMAGTHIVTIEGLASNDRLHPVQQAFYDEEAYQCGYCTPGMIVAAVALLNAKPNPTDAEIVSFMDGNLCRCCSYVRILRAVRRAAVAGR